MNIEKITELVTDCVEILKFTEDKMRKEVILEDFTELINNLNTEDQQIMIFQLLEKLENEDSFFVIRSLLDCFRGKHNRIILDRSMLLKFNNKNLIKALIEYSLDYSDDYEILGIYLQNTNLEMQNHVINLIGKLKIRKFNKTLLKIFNDTINNLYSIFEISEINNNHAVYEELHVFLDKNHYHIPEIEIIRIIVADFFSLSYNEQIESFIDLNFKITSIIISKIVLIIKTYIESNSPILVSKLKNFSKKLIKRIKTNIDTGFDQKTIDILINLLSVCFQSIGHFGGLPEIEFLYMQFLRNTSSTEVALASIHAISCIRKFEQIVYEILQKISTKDKFFLDAVSSMIKISPELAENYIIDQIKSDNPRKIILGTFFIPYLNNKELDKLTIGLLNYKQPMIIRQALWIISKKKLILALPSVINFLFSDNIAIKTEARTTLVHLNGDSLNFLEKRINYYSGEKKEILNQIIESMKEN